MKFEKNGKFRKKNFLNPNNLEIKICKYCARPFSWRKKWEKDWENVKYCSKSCSSKIKN
tara:strand:+ start:371 stop:547 length:177 start_codon:yes stop_codon:yes gene_type:complete